LVKYTIWDVLRVIIGQKAAGEAAELQAEWERTIERQRAARLHEYRELTIGKIAVWQEWQQTLPVTSACNWRPPPGCVFRRAPATPIPPRAAQISRLSMGIIRCL